MLRLRTKDNKKYKVGDDVAFIEICDANGALGALIQITNDGTVTTLYYPGDQTFENYIIKYNTPTAKFYEHNPNKNKT